MRGFFAIVGWEISKRQKPYGPYQTLPTVMVRILKKKIRLLFYIKITFFFSMFYCELAFDL